VFDLFRIASNYHWITVNQNIAQSSSWRIQNQLLMQLENFFINNEYLRTLWPSIFQMRGHT